MLGNKIIYPIIFALCMLLASGCQQPDNTNNSIQLTYGSNQQFKYRHNDINVLGHFSGVAKEASYQLNNGTGVSFYIKGIDIIKDSISRNRLFGNGDFNIEIPISSTKLSAGDNQLDIKVIDSLGATYNKRVTFTWDSSPVDNSLDLTDLSGYSHIQEIGQIVNGAFELDSKKNTIRTVAPVEKDALLLLGSPYGSQEATYSVIFGDTTGYFLGLADFFAGHEAAIPPIGIKPGWSTAGLATISPKRNGGSAQTWLAWGDLLYDDRVWVAKTYPPKPFKYEAGREFRVRQQVIFKDNINRARFKIWPAGELEPEEWLCEESDENIKNNKTKFHKGSFGLFQFMGQPTEWFNIKITPIN
ncbi:MAG: hypothetical protein L3J29_01395 [Cyclobacteriaceae bacterium]|nr:hypothetical protein [Cyclobacteriaceae bacterium]